MLEQPFFFFLIVLLYISPPKKKRAILEKINFFSHKIQRMRHDFEDPTAALPTPNTSTSKVNSALGGITSGTPLAPYP